jgi:hypothetical protein
MTTKRHIWIVLILLINILATEVKSTENLPTIRVLESTDGGVQS